MSGSDYSPKILIADDESILAMDLAARIQKLWSDAELLELCFDGKTAWEQIQEQSPDVVFLDINMPLQSGMQVSERMQQSQTETRVVFVTAYQQ
ncbi:MAG: LytR/AlgR family response regulator transcription factor, partial [Oceanobacter sp.]